MAAQLTSVLNTPTLDIRALAFSDLLPTVPLELFEKAFLIRAVEERFLSLFAAGKLFGTVHTCIGQEWTGIAVARTLGTEDLVFSNHRCHGHYLARTDDVDGLVAEVMGRQTGMCGGRGGSQHVCSGGFYSNGIQGGMVPAAAGIALSQELKGSSAVSVVFIGDGTLGEGIVYETLNLASRWSLPLLIVLENNAYAQSTPQHTTLAGDICARARAFGMQAERANTWDLPQLLDVSARCVETVREVRKPVFLEISTYRLMAHSKGDDDRDPEEMDRFRQRDPLVRFQSASPAEFARIRAAADARVDAAVAAAEAAPFSAPLPQNAEDRSEGPVRWRQPESETGERVSARIHASLRKNVQSDPRIILIGEDIEGPYGGAFKVTRDLSQEYPGRVRNTPISEAALVGMGNGLALGGHHPVCEIMFGDFLMLAADQFINHAAKFRYVYNDQVTVPLIIRTPMGGKRGYGATHSQSLEKHFLGLPNTRVLAIHHRFDPARVYDELFRSIDRPTLVIENKALYAARWSTAPPAGFLLDHTDEAFPTTRLRPGGRPDLTVACYGGMLPDVEAAVEDLFDSHEIICEVIAPMQLYPMDLRPLVQSLTKSGRLLFVEEGLGFAGLGAEVIAQIATGNPGLLRQVARLHAPEHPIPSCGPLEKSELPGVEAIVDAARRLTAG